MFVFSQIFPFLLKLRFRNKSNIDLYKHLRRYLHTVLAFVRSPENEGVCNLTRGTAVFILKFFQYYNNFPLIFFPSISIILHPEFFHNPTFNFLLIMDFFLVIFFSFTKTHLKNSIEHWKERKCLEISEFFLLFMRNYRLYCIAIHH